MKKLIVILSMFYLLPQNAFAQGATLDEVYREIVKANNEDYLPLYVKNRETPNFLKDIENIENSIKKSANQLDDIEIMVSLENKRKMLEAHQKAEELKWQAVILAVQQDKATPYEIEIINNRVAANDPQATEILAFMNAKGIGIAQNLIEGFLLYQKAFNLGIADAKANAILVYKSMSSTQKQKLKSMSY